MLKKGIIGGAALVVATVVVAPKFIGSYAESLVNAQVEALNQQPAYTASITSYEAGWFHSQAQIEIMVDVSQVDPEAPLQPITTQLNVSLQHGPILTQHAPGVGLVGFQIDAGGDSLRESITWSAERDLYVNNGVLGLLGGVSYVDEVSSFNYSDADITYDFSGYRGVGESSGGTFTYVGGSESFTGKVGAIDITVADLKLKFTAEANLAAMFSGAIYPSETVLTLAQVEVSNSGMSAASTSVFGLEQLEMVAIGSLNESKDLAAISARYGIAKANVNEFAVSDVRFDLAMANLSVEFINGMTQALQAQDSMTQEAQAEMIQAYAEQNLLTLLSAEPTIAITEFSAVLPEGAFSMAARAQAVGVDTLPEPLEDPEFWLQHTGAAAEASIDKPLLLWVLKQQMLSALRQQVPAEQWDDAQMNQMAEQQAPMMVEMYQQQGLLVETDERYVLDFSLADGKALLNGTEIPLGQM